MRIGDEVTFWGQDYTAVRYVPELQTVDFVLMDDDKQCRICALEPNYCKEKIDIDECHSCNGFIFVKSEYVKAMSQI